MATYDPKNVTVTVDGTILTGFAEGTFVTCEKMQDGFAENIGAQGEVAIAINADNTGEIVLTLQQTSPSLSQLTTAANAKTAVSIQVIDGNSDGSFKAGGNEAYIRKPASIERSNEIGTREFTFFVADYSQTE